MNAIVRLTAAPRPRPKPWRADEHVWFHVTGAAIRQRPDDDWVWGWVCFDSLGHRFGDEFFETPEDAAAYFDYMMANTEEPVEIWTEIPFAQEAVNDVWCSL